jgi:tetratricopeptide (TPR) repeat protein
VVLSHVQWLTGSPDSAARTAQMVVEYGHQAAHELSLSIALAWTCLVELWLGRDEDCSRHAIELDELVERHGIVTWRPVATFCRGALAVREHPESSEGIGDLRRAVAEFRAIGHMARLPFYIAVLAEALAKQARFPEAEATILEAVELAAVQNDGWCAPEILRIQAFIASAQGKPEQAEPLLQQAITISQRIGAPPWRLRAATDLAELLRTQSRTAQAKQVLQAAYDTFSEGFENRDLVAAARLLGELRAEQSRTS